MSFNFIDEQQATGRKYMQKPLIFVEIRSYLKIFQIFEIHEHLKYLFIYPNKYTSLQLLITLFEYKIYVIIPVVN